MAELEEDVGRLRAAPRTAIPLSASAHVDMFRRENPPSLAESPEPLFDLPGMRYPQRFSSAVKLVDLVAQRLCPTVRAGSPARPSDLSLA